MRHKMRRKIQIDFITTQVKLVIALIAHLALSALLFSCESKKGNGDATVPSPNPACMTGVANCNSAQYSQYSGFLPYPTNPYSYGGYNNYWQTQAYGSSYSSYSSGLNGSVGLCDCPTGTIPTYNASFGLGCVNSTYINGGNSLGGYTGAVGVAGQASIYAYWSWGANGNQWSNIPQISNITGYNVPTQCYSGAVESCFIDSAGSCSGGRACLATLGGSRLGLCSGAGYGSGYGVGNGLGYGGGVTTTPR